MTTTVPMMGRIDSMSKALSGRLDKLGAELPSANPRGQLPAEEYLPRALALAQRDPAFRTQFEQAMSEYRRRGGA